MTGRPSLTIEELLTRYERYDVKRRAAHIPHPSRTGFIAGFDDAGLGKSKQTLYNYEEHYNLPWPLLPEDASIFVWVLFGQSPFDLTWVRQSLATALDRPVDQLVARPSVELLRHGVPLGDNVIADMRRLKEDPTLKVAVVEEPIDIDVAFGRLQSTRMEVRYTGAKFDRFYVTAQPIGVPFLPETGEVFNVEPGVFFEMKRAPQPQLAAYREAFRAVQGRGIGELVDTVLTLNQHPELMREYLNQTLPKYEFPDPDKKT